MREVRREANREMNLLSQITGLPKKKVPFIFRDVEIKYKDDIWL